MERSLQQFCEKFLSLSHDHVPMVVVTMTSFRGSAPQDTGARMIVGEKEILFGTVGGGKIEKKCLELAREFLSAQKSVLAQSFTWNLQRDIGMSCGGEVTMFFEPYRPVDIWKIAIFGAGHISQELTRALLRLDCRLTVIDSRRDWLAKLPEHPRLEKIESSNLSDELERLPPDSFVALMTMGHATDAPILMRAMRSHRFPYLGVIGSPAKRNRLELEMKEQALDGQFFCPMGEDFGKNSPAEIALSITGQLLRERDRIRGV